MLGELKNVGATLPHKVFKKPEAIHVEGSCIQKHLPKTIEEVLRESLAHLTTEQINEYHLFVNQRRDLRTNFLLNSHPQDFINLDQDIAYDPASVSPFAETIFNYLQDLEFKRPLDSSFLAKCVAITPRMRYILVNWLVQVHQSYKLQPETLYLCVGLMDRYIQVRY